MKYVDEYRDAALVRKLADAITRVATRPWTIMEICGGQTHAIVKFGIDELLPKAITLVHVGFAINTIDEKEANQVFEYLREMDELAELDENEEK